MSCSDDLQTDSSQNVNDSDEHRTGLLSIFRLIVLFIAQFLVFMRPSARPSYASRLSVCLSVCLSRISFHLANKRRKKLGVKVRSN